MSKSFEFTIQVSVMGSPSSDNVHVAAAVVRDGRVVCRHRTTKPNMDSDADTKLQVVQTVSELLELTP